MQTVYGRNSLLEVLRETWLGTTHLENSKGHNTEPCGTPYFTILWLNNCSFTHEVTEII